MTRWPIAGGWESACGIWRHDEGKEWARHRFGPAWLRANSGRVCRRRRSGKRRRGEWTGGSIRGARKLMRTELIISTPVSARGVWWAAFLAERVLMGSKT